MIYVTGDLHGDVQRLKKGKPFWFSKHDTLIVLGDFGFLWNDSAEERAALEWLKKRRYKILFLDGCNENFDMLAAYPTTEQFGGRVQPLGGNVYHVCRGSVLELEGLKLLCFGGGETIDKEEREPGANWWASEMPTEEEYAYCRENLERHGHAVDFILTHDSARRLLDFTGLPENEWNQLHRFLDEVILSTCYQKWYFGRYHKDMRLSPKASCVFREIIPLTEKGGRHKKA